MVGKRDPRFQYPVQYLHFGIFHGSQRYDHQLLVGFVSLAEATFSAVETCTSYECCAESPVDALSKQLILRLLTQPGVCPA